MNTKKTELKLQNHRDYLSSIESVVKSNPPNIVLVFVDDMGYGDISCFGSTAIHTPNLDALAENSVKMHSFTPPARFAHLLDLVA